MCPADDHLNNCSRIITEPDSMTAGESSLAVEDQVRIRQTTSGRTECLANNQLKTRDSDETTHGAWLLVLHSSCEFQKWLPNPKATAEVRPQVLK